MIQHTRAKVVRTQEIRRSERQGLLDRERSQLERNRVGQFATPNLLAIEIVRYLVELFDRNEPIRFLEPALGSGSFYSALLQVVEPTRIHSAVGFEIDRRFVTLARELWGDLGLEVVEGDFTGRYMDAVGSNLVLTNPPYVRHHHLNRTAKNRMQEEAARTCGLLINGLSGLYVYFMALAHASMPEGGVAAWLVPSEFMDVNYGSVLRSYLSDTVQLIRIHRFDPDDVQFDDALVSSAVVVFRKVSPPRDSKVRFTLGGTLLEPARTEEVPSAVLRRTRKWTSFPGMKPLNKRDKRVAIGDLFDVRRGLATGANSYFIMSRSRAGELGIPGEVLKPVLPSPRYLRTDIIADKGDGYPLLDPQLVLLDCDLPEEWIRDHCPQLDDYLAVGVELGVNDRYLPSRRSPWYRQERRLPAPYLSTYMGRGSGDDNPFRFI